LTMGRGWYGKCDESRVAAMRHRSDDVRDA
jgi:hypothetical protein